MEPYGTVDEAVFREKMALILRESEKDRSRVIPLLQQVQETFGYLPPQAVAEVAAHLGMTEVQVFGVASFYNHFRFTPLGKYPIQMCMGTACHMVGGGLVLEALERSLEVPVGGITEDGKYSLDRVACVGCCSLAPVMVVGEKIHAKVSPAKVDEILLHIKLAEEEAAGSEGKQA
ncbi:MAG: NADH-quinone oxidoreductase subunit NuoE [Deltaproteobacteria bacterium]|nr:NADH-quinone oxidoreductase subunit NuoE [Deltaproteobacteria bacterium]